MHSTKTYLEAIMDSASFCTSSASKQWKVFRVSAVDTEMMDRFTFPPAEENETGDSVAEVVKPYGANFHFRGF